MPRARTTAVDLARLLDDSDAPIYVLDDERRIVFCNDACQRWTGVSADDLIGRQCMYHSPEDGSGLDALIAALCPPPKVFSGQPQQAVVALAGPDGQTRQRRGHFWPLSDGQDESAAVIALLEPREFVEPPAHEAAPSDLRLHDQVRRFRQEMAQAFRFEGFLGTSPMIVRARAQIELAAASGANVVILGPRGSGKDHAARTIHYRASEPGPLVPLSCAMLETNLMRSTLRALAARNTAPRGAAGTLLLDDVEGMPTEAQADLLELLRSGALRARVIATATRPLDTLASDVFSRELACLLGTITLVLPPLGQRLEDLPLLAQAFLEAANARPGKQIGGFSADALDFLAAYSWPGNIDELGAIVREAHDRATGGEVTLKDLPRQLHWAADAAAHPPRDAQPIVLEEFLARVERELITRAIKRAKGNKSKAAKWLGLTRPRLYRRLVQLGLEPPGAADG